MRHSSSPLIIPPPYAVFDAIIDDKIQFLTGTGNQRNAGSVFNFAFCRTHVVSLSESFTSTADSIKSLFLADKFKNSGMSLFTLGL